MAHAPPPLDAEAAARSRRVVDRLHAASGADGFLPFDRFMEIALYSEDGGYYGRARSPLGPAGDFYTATQVDPLFAECLAARVRVVRAALGSPPRFQVVELGPGDGTLAAGVVRTLATDPAGLEYVLVERASSRARDAVERVGGVTTSIPVRTSESLAALGPFVGVVLANELLDAQPTRRLHWDGSAWHEAGIRVIDGRVEAAETELARPVPGAPLPASPPPDLVFEVSPSAEGLVREIADHLVEGEAIVIDYGLDEAELVRSRSGGTLAAVRDHRFLPDPLDAPGAADLSTFVNFTRLRSAARASGLVEIAFRSQAEALGAWGFAPLLDAALRSAPSSEAKVRRQLAAKNLLFGFGRFRALELAPPGTAERLAAAT